MKSNKSYYLCLLLPLFLFSFTDGNKRKSDLEKDGLKGKVKTIHVFYFDKADEKTLAINPLTILKKDTSKHLIINYDENGYLAQHIMSNGKILLINRYDSLSNTVICSKYSEDDKIISLDTSLLDENGNRVEDIYKSYDTDGGLSRTSYNIDVKGNMLESDTYTNGKFAYKWTYKYDESGNRIEDDQFYLLDSFIQKWVYKYDDKRNNIEMGLYTDSLVERYEYKYNDRGNMIAESHYGSDDKLIESASYKYDFDDKGNWIRCIANGKMKRVPVTIRVIEYY